MGAVVKTITYTAIFGGAGVLLFNYAAPTEDTIKDDKVNRRGAYRYSSSDDAKRANDFTNVLIASANARKTVYGAKQAKEQQIIEKAKSYAIMQEATPTTPSSGSGDGKK